MSGLFLSFRQAYLSFIPIHECLSENNGVNSYLANTFSDRHLKLLLRIQQQSHWPVVTQIHLHVALKTAGFHC